METLKNWYEIVERTASHGLEEAKESRESFNKWLAIWALDVVCECHEIETAKNLGEVINEVGDVMWGVAASAILLGMSEALLTDVNDIDKSIVKDESLLDLCARYADLAKKTARDSREDTIALQQYLRLISIKIQAQFEPAQLCLDAVDAKLKKRYPNGFNAADSINRVV
jgi:hypothetical protein